MEIAYYRGWREGQLFGLDKRWDQPNIDEARQEADHEATEPVTGFDDHQVIVFLPAGLDATTERQLVAGALIIEQHYLSGG